MLRAITETTLVIDSEEHQLSAVPNGLLTESEVQQVREVHPDALAGYVCWQPETLAQEIAE